MRRALLLLPLATVMAACGSSSTAGGAAAPSSSSSVVPGPTTSAEIVTATQAPPAGDQTSAVVDVYTRFEAASYVGDGPTACGLADPKGQASITKTLKDALGDATIADCSDAFASLKSRLAKVTPSPPGAPTVAVAKVTVVGSVATIEDTDVMLDGQPLQDDNGNPFTLAYTGGAWKVDDVG